jgi:competence protein ComEC
MAFGWWVIAAVLGGTVSGLALVAPDVAGCLALALALASCGFAVDRSSVRRTFVVLTVAAVFLAHGAAARDRRARASLRAFGPESGASGRTALVVTGQLAADAITVDSGVRLLIDVASVDDGSEEHRVRGRIQAHVGGRMSGAQVREWTRGRAIHAPMTLRVPQTLLNPGGASEHWQTIRRPVTMFATIKSALVVQTAPGAWWHERAARVRAHVRDRVAALFPDAADPTGAIVVAILIGDRSWLDDGLERRLQIAGTYHVLAISGGNVALLTAGIYLALRLALRSARTIAVLTMVAVATYGWIVGGDPSVIRASSAAILYLALGLRGLAPPALNLVAVIALVLTMADPVTVIDAGAWLSFGATVGIIVAGGRLGTWYGRWGRAERPGARVSRWLVLLCGATVAAELTLLPVAAFLFNRVGVAGLPLNVVAIPMIAVVQIGGIAAILLGGLWQSAAAVAVLVTQTAAAALVSSARLVEVVPWLSWRVPSPSVFVVALFYAAGISMFITTPARLRRTAVTVFAALVIAVAFAPATRLLQPASGWLRLTMVDVGQGDAMLLQFPGGRSLLVDAGGSASGFDVGDRVVAPALWASGVRTLDWLAVTHADLDHIGGAMAVNNIFAPREVWEGVPVPGDQLRAQLLQRAGAWRQLQQGSRLHMGSVTLDVLHPPAPDWERQRVRNDDSLVLRVRYGDVEMLLTGDIGAETERALSVDAGRAPIRVLKLAHHGSRTSSSNEFLSRYAPHVALLSVGRGNPFGHPAPEVTGRVASVADRVFRTDRDGAVVIETDGRGVRVRSMRGRAWTMGVWRRPA